MKRIKLVTIFTLAVIATCATAQTQKNEMAKSAPTAPTEENQPARVLGILGFETKELSDAISAPAAVEANKDFQVTITTSGNGCVSKGDEGIILSESGADIFVYDLTTATRPGIVCTMILKKLDHAVTLRFAQKGEGVIRVWARQQGGASPLGEPVVVEKRVTVR